MPELLLKPGGAEVKIAVTPERAGWKYLSFFALELNPGGRYRHFKEDEEAALVPLSGRAKVRLGETVFETRRKSVFTELPEVFYAPPGTPIEVEALDAFAFAVGSAPAEGKLPPRRILPSEIPVEIRGGENVTRQISHILAPPLPAERLLLFEVYTPSGNWSSWPPHRHDGRLGSPYLEEVYYYRIEPQNGWAVQRVYAEDLDVTLRVQDGQAVLVPRGYHPVVAAPGSNVYYLNYLAGEERTTRVVDDPEWAWMREDWTGRALPLPIGGDKR